MIAALDSAFENLCHWVITQTYIKTAFQTRMLLKLGTYLDEDNTVAHVTRFKTYMTAVNLAAIALIVAMSVMVYIGITRFQTEDKGMVLILVSDYSSVAF